MTKFLIILISIILLIIIGLGVVKRFISKQLRKTFSNFDANPAEKFAQQAKKEVVYEKDDIIVLKGEAKDKNNNNS